MATFKLLNGRLARRENGRRVRYVPGDIVFLSEGEAQAYGIHRLERMELTHEVFEKNKFVTNPVKLPYEVTEAAATYALENGIDLTGVEGSGKDGKITLGDVRALVE